MIAHAVDFATYREDIDRALAEHQALAERIQREPRCWDVWIVPADALVATVRNELWFRQGWTDPDIRVNPSVIRIIRQHR